jgi:hypothetical protein
VIAASRSRHIRATLDDIPGAELDRLAGLGIDWIWSPSVWQAGPEVQAISRKNADWHVFPPPKRDDMRAQEPRVDTAMAPRRSRRRRFE